jgi:hypothetical protein
MACLARERKRNGSFKEGVNDGIGYGSYIFSSHPLFVLCLVQRKIWILVEIENDVTEKLCV